MHAVLSTRIVFYCRTLNLTHLRLKAVTNRPEQFNRLKLTIAFLSFNRRIVAKRRELYDNEILGRINNPWDNQRLGSRPAEGVPCYCVLH